MSNASKIAEYDSEPVKYCSKCLSLKVNYEETQDIEYCGDCGSVNIVEAPFEEWEKKYVARYGHKLIEKEKDPRNHPIFQLTIAELKRKIYNSPNWKEALSCIYHNLPEGYSKIDTILLVFDRLIRENRLTDFKIQLTKIQL